MKKISLFFLAMFLSGCSYSPIQHSDIPLIKYNDETRFGIRERANGFEIEVFYSKHQYAADFDTTLKMCKNNLTFIALDYAEKKGKPLDKINEQRIKYSVGRNGNIIGETSCRAYSFISYKK